MKNTPTPLVEEHLRHLQSMQEATTDDFFYTRLRARMENQLSPQGWKLPVKPAWVVGTLAVLLAINGLMLSQQFKPGKSSGDTQSSIQNFATAYDQSISGGY